MMRTNLFFLITAILIWNSHILLVNAQPPFSTPDNIGSGNCLSFDGVHDLVDLNYSTNNLNSPITFTGWVKPGLAGRAVLISGYRCCGGVAERWDLEFDTDGNSNICWHEHGGTDLNCSTSPADLNVWTHFAVVHDQPNRVIKFYINGVLSGTGTIDRTLKSTVDLSFGGRNTGDPSGGLDYTGLLDEVSLWDVELSQTQIRDMMTTKLVGNESNLIGYWSMNEGNNTTIYDATSNSIDGDLQNN